MLRVGCSGFDYPHWRDAFYPASVPRSRWLEYYSSVFDSVELNNTFYRLPRAETVARWRERVPVGFCFAVKMSRFGTHRKHLADADTWLPQFFERVERLGPTLGPVLVQLPPRWRPAVERLDAFLTAAGRRHRFAVEVRDARWLCDEVYDVLRRHQAALCIHDLVEHHPQVLTADWVYLRFHGPDAQHAYQGSYRPQALSAAARRIRKHLGEGRDVYAFFNNDVGGHAVRDALSLRRFV